MPNTATPIDCPIYTAENGLAEVWATADGPVVYLNGAAAQGSDGMTPEVAYALMLDLAQAHLVSARMVECASTTL